MLRLLADENLHGTLVRGLRRHAPEIDLVRVQDVGLSGANDDSILQWAADNRRVLATHDVNTIPRMAYARVRRAEPMFGVFVIPTDAVARAVIDDLILAHECSEQNEWQNKVHYVPF